MQRLSETQKRKTSPQNGKQVPDVARSDVAKNPKKRNLVLPTLLVIMGCAVFLFAAWSAINSPVLASILNISSSAQGQAAQRKLFAQVNIAKPAAMSPAAAAAAVQAAETVATATAMPTEATQASQPEIIVPPADQPTLEVFVLPAATDVPSVEQPTAIPDSASEPGVISAQIVVDTPTSEYVAPTAAAVSVPDQIASNGGEHWIDVNLSEQRVYAYEGDTIVNSFLVSTGTWQTPTVTGQYHIWIKLLSTTMTGPGYSLPNVPYTMYFYKGYGLHGTYWHNNFGTPMSHGCVNLRTDDAEWLYNFSVVGTLVNVHY